MGCQLNENDSEKICGMLEEMGYTKTEKIEEATLAILNTCCVRENAEERLFGKVGELKNLKERNNLIIAIGGCMMQEPHILEKMRKSFKYVDIIFGTHTLHKLPEDLFNVLESELKLLGCDEDSITITFNMISSRSGSKDSLFYNYYQDLKSWYSKRDCNEIYKLLKSFMIM